MFSAILILLAMPFTDLSRSRGIQFRPLSKIAFFIFLANFFILMVLGAKHVESPFIEFGQISTVIYFSHFLINFNFSIISFLTCNSYQIKLNLCMDFENVITNVVIWPFLVILLFYVVHTNPKT